MRLTLTSNTRPLPPAEDQMGLILTQQQSRSKIETMPAQQIPDTLLQRLVAIPPIEYVYFYVDVRYCTEDLAETLQHIHFRSLHVDPRPINLLYS